MAFTKDILDYLSITPDGVFEYRRVARVFEDGELLGERNHRTTYPPDTDKATMPPKLAAIANIVWTPAVIAAWEAKKVEAANNAL